MTPAMEYSISGLELTEGFEGCELIPYQDSAGIWTDGYGNTHGVVPGVAITQEKAEADLVRNVQTAVYAVNHYVAIHLRQNEFDSLVDFCFNCGAGNFASSTMLRKLNQGDLVGAAREFERWDMAGGKHVAGLLRRRKAEEAMFELLAGNGPGA